ncbi:MAG: hypothetical protein J0H98_08265 [Solirubrobacterales bacterium]|nr:hypothetical protein [Solirubrobacterales bacterium]
MSRVTDRRLVAAIESLTERHGFAPTIRELGTEVGLASSSSVARRLQNLKRNGVVDFEPRSPRTLRVIRDA